VTLDVLVVAYCGWHALAETLASLALWSEPGYRLTVFENSVRNYRLTSIWNRFVEQSTRDVVALCNPDVIVGPGWDTESLACFAQHADCAAVAPVSNTRPHQETLKMPLPDALTAADVERVAARFASPTGADRFYVTTDERMVPGHCALIRRRAWQQVGGFDERLAFGGNDFDFNRRLVAAGMTLAVATRAFSFHRWGVSTADAIRLSQFDVARNEPRFRHAPADLHFDDL
jgi:GT2 family glycosyltransferase